jgi:hypothetical protein
VPRDRVEWPVFGDQIDGCYASAPAISGIPNFVLARARTPAEFYPEITRTILNEYGNAFVNCMNPGLTLYVLPKG